MARMRTVKPALRTSEVVASWPFEVRYAWVLLWGYLDDKGRGLDMPKAVAGDLFPLDEQVDARVMEGWLRQMTKGLRGQPGPLCRYQVGDRKYLHAVNWDEHQKPGHPTPSQHPPCPIHEELMSPSHLEGLRGRGVEGEKPARESLTSAPPRGCARHPNGTTKACRDCGDARKTAEAWEADRRARLAAAPKCPDHPDQPAHNCGSCRADRLAGDVA